MEWQQMTGSSICSALLCSVGDKHQLDFSLDWVFLSRKTIAIFAAMDFLLEISVIILLFEDIFREVCLTFSFKLWMISPSHSSPLKLNVRIECLESNNRKTSRKRINHGGIYFPFKPLGQIFGASICHCGQKWPTLVIVWPKPRGVLQCRDATSLEFGFGTTETTQSSARPSIIRNSNGRDALSRRPLRNDHDNQKKMLPQQD
jgi:hypothetical protein